jgi:hypothetical protein
MQTLLELASVALSQLNIIFSAVFSKLYNVLSILRAYASTLPNWLLWLFIGVLITAGLWLIWRGLARRSKLLKPEALYLNLDNPEHLCGREDDLQSLVAAVALKPVVFLEGEAGVGKSALVRAGLIPTLYQVHTDIKLIPVYINCYNNDWDQGLYNRLTLAIRHTFAAEKWRELNIDQENFPECTDVEPNNTRSLLHHIHDQLGNQRLLLIFDQFDDYLVTHHQQFLRNGRWLTAKELIAQNEFWCGIYNELEHRNLHCLFITRRRWAMALEAVRFRLPVQRAVDLVPANIIADLLSKLTNLDSPVISNPNVGWTALKDLLIQDLANRNRILPVQATLAFKSLRELPELSIEAYENIGRLEGMETAIIQNAVLNAAKTANVSESQVRNVLLTMVDETIPLLPKACIVNETAIFIAAKTDATCGARLLASLEHSGIIRQGLGATKSNGCAWTLYHDYLARLVLIMQRHAGRWQRLLQARHRTFYTVKGLRAKWGSLLAPKELFGLLRETIFGQVEWDGYKFFASISTLRIIPFIVIAFLFFNGIRYGQDLQARNTADLILQNMQHAYEIDNPVTSDMLRQFWVLAASERRLKLAFVERSLLKTSVHPILIKHIDLLIQSLFGLDPNASKRKEAMRLILFAQANKITFNQQILSYPVLLAASIYLSNPNIFKDSSATIYSNIEAAIRTNRDLNSLIALGQILGHVEKYFSSNQVQAIAERLVEAMYSSNDTEQVLQIAQALTHLGTRLPLPQAKSSVERLISIMRGDINRNLLITVGQIITKLGANVPTVSTETAVKYLIKSISASTDPEKMNNLVTVLINLTQIMQPNQIQTTAQSLVTVMHVSKDREQLNKLRQTLILLAPKLPQTEIIIDKLANYLRDSHDPDQRVALSQTILELGKFLQSSQLHTAITKLVENMVVTRNPDQLAELGNDLGNLVTTAKNSDTKLLSPQIQKGIEHLVTVMTTSLVPRHLAELGEALATFDVHLPENQTAIATTRLIEAMRVSAAAAHLIRLGQALSSFNNQLPRDTAQIGAERLLEILEAGTDPESLAPINQVLNTLGARLSNVPTIIERLLILLNQTQETEHLTSLITTLNVLCQHLTLQQRQEYVLKILDMIITATDPVALAGLCQVFANFLLTQPSTDMKLLRQQAQIASNKIIEIMHGNTDWKHLVALGNSLADIASVKNFTPPINITTGIERLIEAMRANTIPDQLAILGNALHKFKSHLPFAIAQAASERLIAVMRTNTVAEKLNELNATLNSIINILPQQQIQALGNTLIDAMQASSDEEQWLYLGSSFVACKNKLTPTQIHVATTRLVEMLHIVTENTRLITVAEFIISIDSQLPPNLAQTTAQRLVTAMRASNDEAQLISLGNTLIQLAAINNSQINIAIAPHLETGAMRLIELLQLDFVEPIFLEQINLILTKLSTQISSPQLQTVANKLIEAIHNSNNRRELIILTHSFTQLEKMLPAQLIQAATMQLIATMQQTTKLETFAHLATKLATFPTTSNKDQISHAVELLKSPLAIGETKLQILKFIGKLAKQNFDSSDAFVSWAQKNLILDLTLPPLSPFQ